MKLSHHSSPSRRPARRGERGVMVVLVALSVVSVLLVATLVIDGSQAYPQRRTAQNAADNSATAATQALDKKKWFGGTADVRTVANQVAEDNHASVVDCWFITGGRDVNGAIERSEFDETCDVGDAVPIDANGVQVRTVEKRATTFGGLGEIDDDVSAHATAAASVQKLISVTSPFVVCGNPDPALAPPPGALGYDLLKTVADGPDANTLPDFSFNSDGTVDVDPAKAAVLNKLNGGKGIPLVAAEKKVPRCGLTSANFDGNGSNETTAVPGWTGFSSGGGHDGEAAEQVLTANPCPDPFPPAGTELLCDIILPIAISGDAATDRLYVVALGVFQVNGNGLGNPKYYGRYVASAHLVAGGVTTTGPITANTLRVIGLIQ